MLDEIYNKKILKLAGNIPLLGRLDKPDGSSMKHSKLCGSRMIVDIKMQDAVVTEYAHDVRACALGQAAASIMARNIIGSNADELVQLRDKVLAMLKHDGPPPQGKWQDIEALEPVKNIKARHASTMLVFYAVCEAVSEAQKD